MCRHLVYLGPPLSPAVPILDAPHGLLHQSYAPADMRGGGTVNADGFGAAWYPPGAAEPVRYRSDRPLWSDSAFPAVVRAASATGVLAAVRSATTGMPVTVTAAAPFTAGRWAFSHNGVVRGWPDSMRALAARLPVTDLLTLDAPTDSALLWALIRHRLAGPDPGLPGPEPGAVLAGVVADVAAAAPGSRLNLLLTEGTAVWATAWEHALSVRVAPAPDEADADPMPGPGPSVLVASEPIDPFPGWTQVPDRHLLTARPGRHHLSELEPSTKETR